MSQPIPKVIHYCWFGGKPLPMLAQRCIASWKRYLPDYEIREWNEQNYNVWQCAYSAEAYRLKSYAHVSDYARFWILYHYGGIYFDTDVEVIRPLDDIISKGAFTGFECQEGTPFDHPNGNINPGLGIGSYQGHPFLKLMLESYKRDHFVRWNGKNTDNVPLRATRLLNYDHKKVLEGGIVYVSDLLVYPIEYFCPLNYYTHQLTITHHTRTIHHYMASWVRKTNRWHNAHYRLIAICVRFYYTIKHHI